VDEQSEPNPISLYGILKRRVEEEVSKKTTGSFCPTFLRMATLFGLSPRMRFELMVNFLAMNAALYGKVTAFNGAQYRPLVHGDARNWHLLDRLIPNQTTPAISLITERIFLQETSF
jgi:dTDP-4-dehydrorhamnose reductase